MAVAFDVVSAPQNFNGATSLSWSHAGAASPTNYYARCLVNWTSLIALTAVAKWDTAGTNTTMPSVTSKAVTNFQATLHGLAQIFELTGNPTNGTVTVGVTNGTNAIYGGGVGSITYTGVHQTPGSCSGTPATPTIGTSTTPSITVTGTTAGNITGDCMSHESDGSDVTTPVAQDTARLTGKNSGGGGQAGGAQDIASGGDVTLNWTIARSLRWIQVAAEILAAGAGGTTGWGRLLLDERNRSILV